MDKNYVIEKLAQAAGAEIKGFKVPKPMPSMGNQKPTWKEAPSNDKTNWKDAPDGKKNSGFKIPKPIPSMGNQKPTWKEAPKDDKTDWKPAPGAPKGSAAGTGSYTPPKNNSNIPKPGPSFNNPTQGGFMPPKGTGKSTPAPEPKKGGNSGSNSGGSFASSFDAYSKRPDAKIGDTFEHNGKKYKFEYADKKKNEEFTKNKQSTPAPEKSYDKSKGQVEYKTNVEVKGKGTPDNVQNLPIPQVAKKTDYTKLAPIGGQSQVQLAKK